MTQINVGNNDIKKLEEKMNKQKHNTFGLPERRTKLTEYARNRLEEEHMLSCRKANKKWQHTGEEIFIKKDVSEMTSFSGKTAESLKAIINFQPNFKVVLC